jgi:hypothetical protein
MVLVFRIFFQGQPRMYQIFLKRELHNKVARSQLEKYIHEFMRRAFQSGRGRGWRHAVVSSLSRLDKHWLFVARITCEKTSGHQRITDKQWALIVPALKAAISANRWKRVPWELTSVTDVSGNPITILADDTPIDALADTSTKSLSVKDYGTVNLEMGDHFDHIFDRNPHILRVYSAIETAVQTKFYSRNHCVLYGPPACGKTEILLAFGQMMGKENQAFMKFDATSMTQAGVLRILTGSGILPPVLIVEEIEKTSDRDLRWLLGLLDKRGEVRQTNFNVGNRMKNAKMLCLATVNDMDLFRRVMSGALASRFSNQIYCSRPSETVMRMILAREIKLINGKEEWIEPTIEFCVRKMQWNDPRKIIPVCLCGKDRLLDGSYQEAILATLSPEGQQELK